MQNKPNSPNVQIYINIYETKDYKYFIPLAGQKNKPNSNPIKPNLRKAKMNVNLYVIENYRKKDDFLVRINKPNSNPISVKPKMSANVYIIEDYENETAFRPQKNKPKTNPISSKAKIACQKIRPHPSKLRMENNSLPWDQKGYNMPINPAFLLTEAMAASVRLQRYIVTF